MGQASYIGSRINASAKMATGRFQGGSVAIQGTAGQKVKKPKKKVASPPCMQQAATYIISKRCEEKIRQKIFINRPRLPMMAGSKCGADEREEAVGNHPPKKTNTEAAEPCCGPRCLQRQSTQKTIQKRRGQPC